MRKFDLPRKRILNINLDKDSPVDPRADFENLGEIVSWHKRYSLGDINLNMYDYSSLQDCISKNSSKNDIIIPLYIYDHSGITISIKPFSCPWDSGQFGFIKVSKDKIRKEFNCKRVTQKILEKVNNIISSEIDIYDKYLRGENYYFEITDCEGESEDSCCGFIGINIKENGILDHLSLDDKEAVLKSLN